jgi:hypothetical protein
VRAAGGAPATAALAPETPRRPKCGSGQLHYLEDVTCERDVDESRSTPTRLVINGFYTSEGWDEGAENPRLSCRECGAEFPIPEGVELEFV